MIRIAKLTDYGVVLMARLAREGNGRLYSVAELASVTGLPQPTVSKVLKLLTGSDLLSSVRGAHGGYRLGRAPADISIGEIVNAVQGSVALVDCLNESSPCSHEARCALKTPWERINRILQAALEELTLADVAGSPGEIHAPGAGDCGKSDAHGRGAEQ